MPVMDSHIGPIVDAILAAFLASVLAVLARLLWTWLQKRLPKVAAFLRPALPYFTVIAVCTALGLGIQINRSVLRLEGTSLRLEGESAAIREALIAEPVRFKTPVGQIFADSSNGPSQRLKARGMDKDEWKQWEVNAAPMDSFAFQYWTDDHVPEQADERAGGALFLLEQTAFGGYRGLQLDIRVTDMQCSSSPECQPDIGVRLALGDGSGREINAWEISSLAKAHIDLGPYWHTILLDRGDFSPMTPDTSPAPSMISKIAFLVKKDHVRDCKRAKVWVRRISLLRMPTS